MADYSVCGIDCDICKFRVEQNCKGCKENEGKIFWGECELYQCNHQKKQEHCGKCPQFPCFPQLRLGTRVLFLLMSYSAAERYRYDHEAT